MRRAQNRRSQFPHRYCLIDTNRNNLSSKSWRRDRLIRLLLQFGHVITRNRLYSLIEWVQISILLYRPKSPSTFRTAIRPDPNKLKQSRQKIPAVGAGDHRALAARAGNDNDSHWSMFALMRSSIWSYNGVVGYGISRSAICTIDSPQWAFKKLTTRRQRASSSNDSSPT